MLGVCWGGAAYWSRKHPSVENSIPQNAPPSNSSPAAPPQGPVKTPEQKSPQIPTSKKPESHNTPQPQEIVRITGFTIDPFKMGDPVLLRVFYTNDRDVTVEVKGYFCGGLVENLPDAHDDPKLLGVEDSIWQCALKGISGQKPLPNPDPPRANVAVPDELTAIVVTQALLDKINGNGAIYVAGILQDASGKFASTPYCVVIDKSRSGQLPNLCHTHN
jgi:hypothetical protein